ncbi:MAG: Maf family protein [Promethearchaeota archaeon]
MRQIYLASTSPRRIELLSQLGLSFKTISPSYEEGNYPSGSLRLISQTVRANALEKAKIVASDLANALIISGDTIVVTADGLSLGKPRTPKNAMSMLRKLAGTWHHVLSSVAIIDTTTNRHKVKSTSAKVWFRDASEAMLKAYVATGEPLDKAGGYAIQGQGSFFVKRVAGSYTAVVGLPLEIVVDLLEDFGVVIESHWQKLCIKNQN